MSEMIMERIMENLNRLKLSKIQEILPILSEDNKVRELSQAVGRRGDCQRRT